MYENYANESMELLQIFYDLIYVIWTYAVILPHLAKYRAIVFKQF